MYYSYKDKKNTKSLPTNKQIKASSTPEGKKKAKFGYFLIDGI